MNAPDPSPTPGNWIPSPTLRLWLYGVLAALLSAAGVFGLIHPDYAEAVDRILGAILVVGSGGLTLAAANTPKVTPPTGGTP